MFGVDYYPEHWDRKRIDKDMKAMAKNGISIIRVAEFMWVDLEPEEGRFNFDILDQVFKKAKDLNLKIILGTPTATPPVWLVRKHPEILQKDEYGHVRNFGSRRHYCYNSQVYRDYSAIIIEKMAERYSKSESLYAWQIDNEFGCENTTYCYCEDCDESFRKYLDKNYNDIDDLNLNWGTAFWSQKYNDFSQIETPKKTNAFLNPHKVLDFYRFSTEGIHEYAKIQIDIIKKYSDKPITHNFMVNFGEIDYKKHHELYDFISYDSYMPVQEYNPMITAFNFDLMYSLKKKPFTIMEQQPGRVNWQEKNIFYSVDWLKNASIQPLLHGAEDLVYFRWRAIPYGAEQFHNGIIGYDGSIENSERLKMIKQLKEMKFENREKAKIAIYFDYQSNWMHKINNVSKDFDYYMGLIEIYSAFKKMKKNIDIVFDDDDFEQYDLLVVPYAYYLSPKAKEKIENREKKTVITCMTGLKEYNNHIKTKEPLGFDLPYLKFTIKDFGAILTEEISLSGKDLTSNYWIEDIELQKGKVYSTWKSGPLRNRAAILKSEDDKTIYISTVLEKNSFIELLKEFIDYDIILPDKVEFINGKYINFSHEKKVFGNIELNPYEIKGT
ncbi:MAG: beta-galactosidase [Thermotogota bacterium]